MAFMLFQGPCQGRRQTVKYRLPALGAEGMRLLQSKWHVKGRGYMGFMPSRGKTSQKEHEHEGNWGSYPFIFLDCPYSTSEDLVTTGHL